MLVRGLRVISDFEMEYQMALTNQQLCPEMDTICLMTRYEYAFLSASVVKEVFMAGGDVSQMVHPPSKRLERKREQLNAGQRQCTSGHAVVCGRETVLSGSRTSKHRRDNRSGRGGLYGCRVLD